jgi:hemerythrin
MDQRTPAFAVWKPSFALQIPTIDAEHRRFLAMMNELHDAMSRDGSEADLRAIRANLMAYARFHFAGEEELLEAVDFPGRATHLKQHAWFLDQLSGANRTESSRSMLAFMKDWFVQHILGADKSYAAWMNANVSVAPLPERRYYPPASSLR